MLRKLLFIPGILLFPLFLSAQQTSNNDSLELVEIQTSAGNMLVWLYDETPQHKENFIKLAKDGFYDSTAFHRVIQNFMIQGGDPESKDSTKKLLWGNGGPGYTLPAEFNPKIVHKKGTIAAARLSDNINPQRESSGSQFYIVQGMAQVDSILDLTQDYIRKVTPFPDFTYTKEQREAYTQTGGTPHLDMQYTVFGELVYGTDVLDKIAAVPVTSTRPNQKMEMKLVVVKYTKADLKKKYKFSVPEF